MATITCSCSPASDQVLCWRQPHWGLGKRSVLFPGVRSERQCSDKPRSQALRPAQSRVRAVLLNTNERSARQLLKLATFSVTKKPSTPLNVCSETELSGTYPDPVLPHSSSYWGGFRSATHCTATSDSGYGRRQGTTCGDKRSLGHWHRGTRRAPDQNQTGQRCRGLARPGVACAAALRSGTNQPICVCEESSFSKIFMEATVVMRH